MDEISKTRAEQESIADSTSSRVTEIIPPRRIWLRAAVAVIPYTGGALDHLLFDRADEIRLRNIEIAIEEINCRISEIGEVALDISWFESEEALAMFRLMADRVQFEPDKSKSRVLAQVVAASGTQELSDDNRKLSVFEHLSRLSYVQLKLLKIISGVQPARRQLSSKGAITQTVTALWLEDILRAVENNPDGQFWDGTLDLSLELEILDSLNVLRKVPLLMSAEPAYQLTSLGREAIKYLERTNA